MAIIAILVSLAYPSYQEQVRKVRRGEARTALIKTMLAQEQYYTKFNTYFAFDQTTDLSALPFRSHASETAASSYHSITAEACGTAPIEQIGACVLLTATPGNVVGGKLFKDDYCGAISLTSSGIREASGKGGEECWK